MIRILKKTEAKEIAKSETKKEKADRRKQYWKDWRQERKIDQEQNDGGYDDVYEEMDMSKANYLASAEREREREVELGCPPSATFL